MWSKRSTHKHLPAFCIAILGCLLSGAAFAQETTESNVVAPPPAVPLAAKIKGVDADSHTVVVNKPGPITLVLGTSEDSQYPARQAGKAMYPFQGRRDFQLIVVVDLRDSIANWVPSMVLAQMRANLDKEAIELKPYFLQNGNPANPRQSSHVIADFDGAIFPKLGWEEGSDSLRGILFGADGREIKRWSKIQNMNQLQEDVRLAITALDASKSPKKAPAAKNPTKASPANP